MAGVSERTSNGGANATESKVGLGITSDAFAEGEEIPRVFTCDGEDRSPALAWNGVPAGTRSLALICSDPDAPRGTWIHWVIYNLRPESTGIPENVPARAHASDGGTQGMNDFGKVGYGGPCPPSGVHRYEFTIHALDLPPSLEEGLDARGLRERIRGHTLATATLTGRYGRK